MSNYPKEYIRGVSNKAHLEKNSQGTFITQDALYFKDYNRGHGCKELSINWNDDSNAINFSLNQKKDDDTYRFKPGVAVLKTDTLSKAMVHTLAGIVYYERKEEQGNKYHGNILIKKNATKPQKQMLLSAMILSSEFIERKN